MANQSVAAEKLQDACCLLLSREPWYGHAATFFDWIPSTQIETMGVRIGQGRIVECFYHPSFVAELSIYELYTVIQHEVEHVVRCHCTRAGVRNARIWNIAVDMAVNGRQSHPNIGYRGKRKGLTIPFREKLVWVPELWDPTLSAETYYEMLKQRPDCLPVGFPIDDHSLWAESDISMTDAIDIACHIAEQAAGKNQGQMPGHVRRILDEIQQSRTPWHVLLARFISRHTGGRRTTYSRRNRRKDLFGMPGHKRRSRPHVTVIVDVSGSISPPELATFFGEIERICAHARLDVLLWDCEFQGFHRHYQRGDWKKIEMTGGGGTDMAAPVHWLIHNRCVADCVIIFTDGFFPWPEPQPFPMMAVLLPYGHSPPPWLPTVQLPAGEGTEAPYW